MTDIQNDKWYRRWWAITPDILRKYRVSPYHKVDETLQRLADNRLVIGHYRYEHGRNPLEQWLPKGDDWDFLSRLQDKLNKYTDTGNREFLVDMYNYLRFEWSSPSRKDTYFKPVDQGINEQPFQGYEKGR